MAEPEEVEDVPDFNPVDFIAAARRRTMSTAVTSLEDDPEKASRALELAEATGENPAIVFSNLENFEQQHKTRLASSLLNSNEYLRRYIEDEPLAAKVSNDDYGQLDAVAEKTQKLGAIDSVIGAAFRGFKENFDAEGLVVEHEKLAQMLASHPAFAATLVQTGLLPAASSMTVAMKLFGGVVGGAAAGIGESYKQFGGNEAEANRLTRDLIIMAQVALSGQAGLHGIVAPEIRAAIGEASRLAKVVNPYVAAGKEPPVGLHPIIDEAKVQQAKLDADNLSDALKEAAKSTTRERNPDLFASYVRKITDGEIGISADAVRKLYGEKPPIPGEGPLGFVDNLADQLRRAEATGGDIKVSVADWLAKVEPEVAKELGDHIRARPEGVTVEEWRALTPPEAMAEEPIQVVRQSAGLQGIQERKLTLERGQDVGEAHVFVMRDATGKDIGELYIAEEAGGKRLFIDDIRSPEGPQSLGPKAMRDALEQLKEQFPNAETLEGMRVSGAREKANKPNVKTAIDLTKIKPRKKPEQLELDVTRMEDKEAFAKASAIGMTVEQYKRYQKLIDKQHAEDVAYYTKRAEAKAKKKISAEWKEAEIEIRPEVVQQINAQPDVAADNYLRTGYLYGDKVQDLKLNEDLLSLEQKAALPKEYYSKTGIHPDDLASLVGYPSGQVMLNSLADFVAKRKASGMNPDNYRRRLISAEIDRQVNERLGKRAEEILEEAKEQVLSETQQQLLHEQTMRLAEEAGAEFSITKEDLIAGIQSVFERSQALDKAIASDTFLADAGRAGKAMEMALLKGDAAEAFRQSQRQYNAFVFAREALKLEAERAKLEKVTKKYTARREVKHREQSAVNYIQSLLSQAGVKLKLLPEEIQAAIQHEGYTSFADYVADKQQMGWEPAVSDQLQTLGAKRFEQMTVAEFRDFKDAIDSLDFIGQKENKINLLGEALDWEEFRSKVIGNLQTLPARPREGQGRWMYKLDASLTRIEELVKDFDLRQELGPIYSAVIEPMMKSKAMSFDLMTDLSKHFKQARGDFGLRWRRSLSETIPQDFLIDSYSHVPLDMTRENLINVMLNWGNWSNIEKFTRGYASLELGRVATKEEAAAFEMKVKHLIDTHARKEDWDYVSRMWEPFKKWQPLIDTLSRNTSGVAPKWIKPEPIQTPHGIVEGGYWPVKYDRLGSDMSVIEDRKPNVDGLFGPQYIRATTAKGHLKERTGYVDFVDIHNSIEQAAGVMQQSIHDIAYRDALIQASKVFYDKPIRAAIRKYYGSEYEAQLIPWLKRIANQFTTNEAAIQGLNGWLRRVRINLVGHALPLNLKVILSPDIGVPDPKAWTAFEANRAENVKFAMEHSNEIRHLVYNMDRDFREQLERSIKNHTWDSIQAKAVEWGFTPVMKVSQEFRMSTFVDQWQKAKAEGRTDHEASVIADSYVRERHGAASIVDLPAVMESNEALKQVTMFYGYFNTMYNWQRQLPGNVRRREVKNFMVNGLGSVVVGAAFGAALFNQAKENDSWWKVIGKALLLQPLSTIPIVRDAANYFMEGFPQRSPTGSLISSVGAVATDIKRVAKGEKPKRPIQTTANVLGATTGLPMAQVGRTGQFIYDVNIGKQRPRNIFEYIRGIIHGEARLRP